ncbi:hypothetical protein IT084_08590 [Desulfallas sp. Bu1-1]|uniref:hypothetical protein n=1 Tax=Desulfallas sp. Bu1-1 TaxID=2787620 RepID=UPI0018A12615|nr:hypothetical protein [Desulfallas sp. Bu1-1]MBF7083033.1 hypothetical protein [Desulfallas sp. Bu1-1]
MVKASGGKVFVNDVEYRIKKGPGTIKLQRRDPVSGIRVENVFTPGPDSSKRLSNFKAKAAELVLNDILNQSR